MNIDDFFATARERYRIMQKKDAGESAPWTNDHVLASFRFCNVHREDDKTTRWFRENIRDPFDNPRHKVELILCTIGFRWFNYIPTGEIIQPSLMAHGWDSDLIWRLLRHERGKLITGAYMIKTPARMTKLEGILQCMDKVQSMPEVLNLGDTSLEKGWEVLRTIPYIGDFMAYEIITDLRHTCLFKDASDIMFWANPGPGAARGCGWVFHNDPTHYNRNKPADRKEMMRLMRWLLQLSRLASNWPIEHRPWEMREVEHWLCEFDKYCRGRAGQKLKRRYRNASDQG